MKIDLTCPVELWQYAMPVQDASECTFVLNNLSSKVVTSVLVTFSCFDKDNNLLFRQSERIQGLRAGVGERFNIMIMPTQWKDAAGIDLTFEKVWFDDATIWRRGNAPIVSYTPNNLPNGRALDELRFVAGQDAVGYPAIGEQVWLCVCGRANPLDSMRCCRCERNRESTFASFNKQNVSFMIAVHEQKLAEVAREAREENSRLTEEEAKKKLRIKRKRRRVLKWCLTGATVAAACVVTVVWIIPAVRYNSAVQLKDNGQYQDARTAFAAMGDYGDAQALILECDYGRALQLAETEEEASLLEAGEAFEALGDYQDSPEQVQRTSYRLGQLYLSQKLYDKAMGVFQALGDYEDSADMCNRCIYEQAEELYQNDNESVALALFMSIPQYQDAAVKAQACYYTMAQKQVEANDDVEAARLFALAGEYEDAQEQHNQAVYRIATAKLENGDLEGAGRDFLSLGDYLDASAKADDCLYQYAQGELQAGNYETAAAAFELVPDYLDSQGQATLCRYQQAVELMEVGDYASAAPLFEMTITYDDSQRRLNQCYYTLAQQATEQGDSATAERFLEQLDGYEDSARLLRIARYETAESFFAAGNYEEALPRYQAQTNFRDSADKLERCRYEVARQAYESGDYERAISLYSELGRYEDSAAMLSDAYYQQALAYEQAGNVEAALELLPQTADHQEAQNKLVELLLDEGTRLETAGDTAAATELYRRMGNVDAAQERVAAAGYQQAAKLLADGDVQAAGEAFMAVGDYEDAADMARQCFEQIYGEQAETARQAMEDEDYFTVIRTLRDVDRTRLPNGYTDLAEMYREACYDYAEQLYRDGEPYQAMPFYAEAEGYGDADEKLERRAYLVLGSWESAGGVTAVFNTDGTCQLDGETMYFRVNNFSLYTGETRDNMTVTHRFSSLSRSGMSLRELSSSRDYRFTKTADVDMPEMDLGVYSAKPLVLPTQSPEAAATAEPSVTEPVETAPADTAPAATALLTTVSPTIAPTPSAAPAAEPTASPASTGAAQELDEFIVTED